jgi:branched-chain amino acid transport system permease protein
MADVMLKSPYALPTPVRWSVLLALVAALAVFPLVYSNPTITSIGVFTLIFGISASAWNIFSGYTGYIVIGSAVFYGIGQYTVALLASHYSVPGGWDQFGLLPVAGLFAGLASVPIGWLLLRVRSHTFIILTIAVMYIFQLCAFNFRSLTQGSLGVFVSQPGWAGQTFNNPFYYVALGIMILAVAMSAWIRQSKFGLSLLAIKNDENRALGLGIKTQRAKLVAFAILAVFIGMAGGIYAMFVGNVEPQFAFNPVFDVTILIMTMAGGIGTVSGPVVGVLLLAPLQQDMLVQFGSNNYYLIAYGIVFILILRLLPSGIVPTVTDIWRRLVIWRKHLNVVAGGPSKDGAANSPDPLQVAAVANEVNQ